MASYVQRIIQLCVKANCHAHFAHNSMRQTGIILYVGQSVSLCSLLHNGDIVTLMREAVVHLPAIGSFIDQTLASSVNVCIVGSRK